MGFPGRVRVFKRGSSYVSLATSLMDPLYSPLCMLAAAADKLEHAARCNRPLRLPPPPIWDRPPKDIDPSIILAACYSSSREPTPIEPTPDLTQSPPRRQRTQKGVPRAPPGTPPGSRTASSPPWPASCFSRPEPAAWRLPSPGGSPPSPGCTSRYYGCTALTFPGPRSVCEPV